MSVPRKLREQLKSSVHDLFVRRSIMDAGALSEPREASAASCRNVETSSKRPRVIMPDIKALDTSRSDPSHFAYIDSMRGLAFLAVLALHTALDVGDFPGHKVLLNGGYGVQLFFLISAVTLCLSMASRERVDKYPVVNFYVRRLFRIAPMFWLAIIFYWSFPAVMPALWVARAAPLGIRPVYFILTAAFLHGWHPYTFNSIVPGGWSIAVEMNFYLLFPMIYRVLGRSLRRSVVAVLLCIPYSMGIWHSFQFIHTHFFSEVPFENWIFFQGLSLPTQLPVFLLGFLAYHLIRNVHVSHLANRPFWAWGVVCFCVMILLSLFRGHGSGFIPDYLLVAMALVLLIVASSGQRVRLIVNPFICYIGKTSYSCYLVHFAALGIALNLLGVHLTESSPCIDTGQGAGNIIEFVELFAISLTLTLFISTITLRYVEKPCIALGRKLLLRCSVLSSRGPLKNSPTGPLFEEI